MQGLVAAVIGLTLMAEPPDGAPPPLAPEQTEAFYAERDGWPVWLDEAGPLPAAERLLHAVKAVDSHGLDPSHYHVGALAASWRQLESLSRDKLLRDPLALARFDRLYTDAFLRLAGDLRHGRLAYADTPHPRWNHPEPGPDPVELLGSTLPEGDPWQALAEQAPREEAYYRLRGALQDYRTIRDEKKAAGEEVNHSLQKQIDRLRVNLERHRWLPRTEAERAMRIEITDFTLRQYEAGEVVATQPVVVGRPHRQTPNLSHRLMSMVFNPRWEVPHTIAVRDLLPRFREDPAQVVERNFTVYRPPDEEGYEEEVDPADVDWEVEPARFNYRLSQGPHATNPMGRVKFQFPNRYFVNLHDTPDRHLFATDYRAYSAGCVRLRDPLQLAEWLLEPHEEEVHVEALIGEGEEEIELRLEHPPPIHILYRTAWVDEEGAIQYRDDIYQRDERLLERLRVGPGG